jgi:hypothetical protein
LKEKTPMWMLPEWQVDLLVLPPLAAVTLLACFIAAYFVQRRTPRR